MTDQVPAVAGMDVQDLKHMLGSSLEFLERVGRTLSTNRCASSDTERSLTGVMIYLEDMLRSGTRKRCFG